MQDRTAWIFGQLEGGCGAGITGVNSENGPSDPGNPIVGSGGGYGGFYCFAMIRSSGAGRPVWRLQQQSVT